MEHVIRLGIPKVSLDSIADEKITMGTGTMSAAIPVTIATDDTMISALDTAVDSIVTNTTNGAAATASSLPVTLATDDAWTQDIVSSKMAGSVGTGYGFYGRRNTDFGTAPVPAMFGICQGGTNVTILLRSVNLACDNTAAGETFEFFVANEVITGGSGFVDVGGMTFVTNSGSGSTTDAQKRYCWSHVADGTYFNVTVYPNVKMTFTNSTNDGFGIYVDASSTSNRNVRVNVNWEEVAAT